MDKQLLAFENSNSWDEYHINMGELCGYPKCCINWFSKLSKINMCVGELTNMIYGKPINNYGYVLCPRCRMKIETKKIKYKKLRKSEQYTTFEKARLAYIQNHY